jgi:hypothetical protein
MYAHSCLLLVVAGLLAACDEPSQPQNAASPQLSTAARDSGQASPYHFRFNGPHADLYAVSAEGAGYREVQLDVFANSEEDVYLTYVVWECDLTAGECRSVEAGNGAIPGESLTRSHGRLHLNVNTTALPDFGLYAGSGGPISLSWTKLEGWSSRSSGHSRYETSEFRAHSHGVYTSSAAIAEGSVLGLEVQPGSSFAGMGTAREGGISISQK